MNLDDLKQLQEADQQNMLGHLDAWPSQLQQAWQAAQGLPLPSSPLQPRQMVLCGMGGSAIGGDLLAALISSSSPIPLLVLRGYDLPAFVTGPETLVIVSSNSGNTEESLAAAEIALSRGVRMLALTTGGALAAHAQEHGYPLWQFAYKSQPRAALGWSFGLLVGLAHRLGLAPTLAQDVAEAVALLEQYRGVYTATSPIAQNPAKRGAGQLIGRLPVFFGSGLFEPVARRWKGQINENAKAWAQAEAMPEANHNLIAAVEFPADHNLPIAAVFITSPQFDHPRVTLRYQLTARMCLENALMVDTFTPQGRSALAQMVHAIQYGDYVSYYVAAAYEQDPTLIAPILELKDMLAEQ